MKAIRIRHETVTSTFAGLLIGILLLGGCVGGPRRAMEGARLYSAGTRSLEAGDAAAAVEDLTRAAELVPHASEIQNHLGMAYWARGALDEAESAFDRALVLDCENEAAQQNRERLMAERSRAASTGQGSEHGG